MWLLALTSLSVGSVMAAGAGPANRDRPQRAIGGALAAVALLLLLAASLELWWHPGSHANAVYPAGLGHWMAHLVFWSVAASASIVAELVLLVVANERTWSSLNRWLGALLVAVLVAPVSLVTWLYAVALVWHDGL